MNSRGAGGATRATFGPAKTPFARKVDKQGEKSLDTKFPDPDFPELAGASQKIWNENARWWDERMKEGNDWHNRLIAPTVQRLLDLHTGEDVVDLACGNGLLARTLALQGARVLACDFSAEFLECAKARSQEYVDRIGYRLIDLTDRNQLATLGNAQFDAAVCNMAIMDMASITPLLVGVLRLLRPNGRFVFSILHPCFHTPGTRLIAERDGNDLHLKYAVQINRYLNLVPELGVGITGQPSRHYYFHRPLSVLLSACFAAGFVLDAFEEPNPHAMPKSPAPLSWDNFTEIPPILVVRLIARPLAAASDRP
jgi:2-polyprenyl-3-methyl-5-hydroxy-6-metoxy-1,4-benzoquinol methylase